MSGESGNEFAHRPPAYEGEIPDHPLDMTSVAGRAIPFATGQLQLESILPAARDERLLRRPSWSDAHLYSLQRAAEISDDQKLRNVMGLIRELKRHPELVAALVDGCGDLREVINTGQRHERNRRQDRGAERSQADRLQAANRRRERRRTRSTRRRGRPRLAGYYCIAYLIMTLHHLPTITEFVIEHDYEQIWLESGFTRTPDYTTVWLYFTALEKNADAFRHVAELLIAKAVNHDKRVGQFMWVDATKWQTNARLEHCCTDEAACKATSERNLRLYKIRPPARRPKRMSEEEVQKLHQVESQTEAFEEEVIPDELRYEQIDLDPTEDWVVEEEGEEDVTPIVSVGYDPDYQFFDIHGHLYRTRDKTAGLRKIVRKSGRVEYWLGGYCLAAVDMFTKTIIALVNFPANDQEYDHYPELMRRVRSATGRYPLAVTADAFYSSEAFYRWNTKRGIATVAPFKCNRHRPNREDYRTDEYDEHGCPRCKYCGGPGDQDLAGCGLIFDGEGNARIRFRCKTPQPGEPGCNEFQSIPCSLNWRLLIPLSRLNVLYFALRKRHMSFEHTFRHWRQLYGSFGKEVMSRLARRGVAAQELRSQAALMLQWFRVDLRQGWLARPDGTLWPTINEAGIVQLSGPRRLSNGRMGGGVGRRSLNRVLSARRRRGLDLPYGPVAIRKGYIRSTAVATSTCAEREGGPSPPTEPSVEPPPP